MHYFFFFKQKTAYEIGLGIPAEPLFRSIQTHHERQKQPYGRQHTYHHYRTQRPAYEKDRKSGSAGMPRPISYAVFCLKKKKKNKINQKIICTNYVTVTSS